MWVSRKDFDEMSERISKLERRLRQAEKQKKLWYGSFRAGLLGGGHYYSGFSDDDKWIVNDSCGITVEDAVKLILTHLGLGYRGKTCEPGGLVKLQEKPTKNPTAKNSKRK